MRIQSVELLKKALAETDSTISTPNRIREGVILISEMEAAPNRNLTPLNCVGQLKTFQKFQVGSNEREGAKPI